MALQKLYLFKWNNYRNKMIKGRPQLANGTQYNNSTVSFNPNDGINAEHVFNLDYDTFNYDYMCEVDSRTNITRSWFIKEVIRLSSNQVNCILVRDIISDYLNDTLNNELMIHRGWCSQDNSAIFNKEGMEFNKIKMSEELLKDWSNTAWIVGYVPLNVDIPQGQESFGILDPIDTAEVISDIDEVPFYDENNKISVLNRFEVRANVRAKSGNEITSYDYNGKFLMSGNGEKYISRGMNIPSYISNVAYTSYAVLENKEIISNALIQSELLNYNTWKVRLWDFFHQETLDLFSNDDINSFNGKIYQDASTLKYYRVKIEYKNTKVEKEDYLVNRNINQQIYDSAKSALQNISNLTINDFYDNKSYGYIEMVIDMYEYELEEITATETYKIVPNQFNTAGVQVDGQPYKMFVMPYDPKKVMFSYVAVPGQGGTLIENKKAIQDAFLSWLTKDSGRILDLQILPFFPRQDLIREYNGYPLINAEELPRIDIKDSNGNIKSIGIWIDNDSFSAILENEKIVQNYKVENECDSYRLSSPHYESSFEFNAVQMRGWSSIKAECTYKPYQPYIHLMPNFNLNSLYGSRLNDARGLVSNCNYAIAMSSEQWATYARTNSTYQLMFDREIQNLEVKHDAQRVKEIMGIGAGVIGTATAIGTGKVGGAIAGGIGTVGAIGNTILNETMLRPEELKYKKDMFEYNLQNIKAQPQTLTKVSGLDINNRLFPVLEYYTCTEEEKLYFDRYLYYNGYRIERIGKIKDYISIEQDYTFIQADIIRMETNIEAHELDYLSQVLVTGVYFMGGLVNE